MVIGTKAATTRVCRICLGAEPPFVRPCACTGTINDVHAACLERWVQKLGGVQCNVCKTNYTTAGSRKLRPLREWQIPGVCRTLCWSLFALFVLALCFAPVPLILSMYFLELRNVALCIFILPCIIVPVILTCFMIAIRLEYLQQSVRHRGANMTQEYYMPSIMMLSLMTVSFMTASVAYHSWPPRAVAYDLRLSTRDEKEKERLRWLGWEVVVASSLIYVILALTLLRMAYAKCAHYPNRQWRTDFIDATRLGVKNQAVNGASNAWIRVCESQGEDIL